MLNPFPTRRNLSRSSVTSVYISVPLLSSLSPLRKLTRHSSPYSKHAPPPSYSSSPGNLTYLSPVAEELVRRRPLIKRILLRLNNMEDRISQLPDGILANIVSLLTMEEAGRTSVLSPRWRNLWKLANRLNFDAPKALAKIRNARCNQVEKILGAERSKYVAWVNHVLRLNECTRLDELRVEFELDASSSHDIDEWIKLIIPRRVKRLEINLFSLLGIGCNYSLSEECFKSFSNSDGIKCLTSLSLDSVNVDGGFLEYLLSKCRNLERLSVSWSDHLLNLKVAGTFVQLKHLKIFRCEQVESIELCAPRLVTFEYFGRRTNFHIGNNPLLTELSIGGGLHHEVTYALVPFSGLLSQLKTISLEVFYESNLVIPQLPMLRNLKHLLLDVWGSRSGSLIGFTCLIVASPYLEKVTLKLMSLSPQGAEFERTEPVLERHECLKEVEIFGYAGGSFDSELVKNILENAVNLEKLVINPCHPSDIMSNKARTRKLTQLQKQHSDKLEKLLPPKAKLSFVI